MIPKPAQYLLRFDDLCPTIPPKRWEQVRELIQKFGVRPILAVIPDNLDDNLDDGLDDGLDGGLDRSPEDPEFWANLRTMEAAGATIAVHGYHHLCDSRGKSLLGLHRRSEFAGVDLGTQRQWISAGFGILREHDLDPQLWVAPRHGFDCNTLRALGEFGVKYISDGFARVPCRRYGVTWIPQQLWGPAIKAKGLWTICIHPSTASSSDLERLQSFLAAHRHQFTSFERVVTEFGAQPLGLWERLYERGAMWRVQRRRRRAGKQG